MPSLRPDFQAAGAADRSHTEKAWVDGRRQCHRCHPCHPCHRRGPGARDHVHPDHGHWEQGACRMPELCHPCARCPNHLYAQLSLGWCLRLQESEADSSRDVATGQGAQGALQGDSGPGNVNVAVRIETCIMFTADRNGSDQKSKATHQPITTVQCSRRVPAVYPPVCQV
jgi:hypothetical protein